MSCVPACLEPELACIAATHVGASFLAESSQAGTLGSVDVVPTRGRSALHNSLRAPGIMSDAYVHVL